MAIRNDDSLWHYPHHLPLGELDLRTEYELVLRVFVPYPCRMTSQVSGLVVEPEELTPGPNELTLRVEAIDRDTILSGSLWLCTTSQERRIVVEGHANREP